MWTNRPSAWIKTNQNHGKLCLGTISSPAVTFYTNQCLQEKARKSGENVKNAKILHDRKQTCLPDEAIPDIIIIIIIIIIITFFFVNIYSHNN